MDVVAVQRETIPSWVSIKDEHEQFWGHQWKGQFNPQRNPSDQKLK